MIPFNFKINDSNEWRVFVNNNKITCISQQELYKTCISKDINLESYGKFIIEYFENEIKNKMLWLNSYSYDFAILLNDDKKLEGYFIEPNGFGKEYSAGSSLFHWLIDYDKMYGNLDNIYMRYVVKNVENTNILSLKNKDFSKIENTIKFLESLLEDTKENDFLFKKIGDFIKYLEE